MTSPNFYEQMIYQAIVSSIGLNFIDLRFFRTISSLPHEDQELFNLFDVIPNGKPLFEVNRQVPSFSSIYGALLQSQPDSFIVKNAKTNFENQNFWLPADLPNKLPQTPIYTPDVTEISISGANGASFDFNFDSSKTAAPTDVLYPSFPSFLVNPLFKSFNQTAAENRFIFKLHFDSMVSQPVRPGGWFSQALFTQAFQSGGDRWLTGPGTLTWESLFGDNGILKFVCNGTLAVRGITLELQIFGQFDKATLDALETGNGTSVWPFYLNVENLNQKYVLGEDGSITITSQVPSTETLLLVMEVASVNALHGSVA